MASVGATVHEERSFPRSAWNEGKWSRQHEKDIGRSFKVFLLEGDVERCEAVDKALRSMQELPAIGDVRCLRD